MGHVLCTDCEHPHTGTLKKSDLHEAQFVLPGGALWGKICNTSPNLDIRPIATVGIDLGHVLCRQAQQERLDKTMTSRDPMGGILCKISHTSLSLSFIINNFDLFFLPSFLDRFVDFYQC